MLSFRFWSVFRCRISSTDRWKPRWESDFSASAVHFQGRSDSILSAVVSLEIRSRAILHHQWWWIGDHWRGFRPSLVSGCRPSACLSGWNESNASTDEQRGIEWTSDLWFNQIHSENTASANLHFLRRRTHRSSAPLFVIVVSTLISIEEKTLSEKDGSMEFQINCLSEKAPSPATVRLAREPSSKSGVCHEIVRQRWCSDTCPVSSFRNTSSYGRCFFRQILLQEASVGVRLLHLHYFSERALLVGSSSIHGCGLFTLVDLAEGQMVIEYTGEVVRPCLTDQREVENERKVRHPEKERIEEKFVSIA